jgi:hypothetical protein
MKREPSLFGGIEVILWAIGVRGKGVKKLVRDVVTAISIATRRKTA